MEIIIKGTPKEIADLINEIQNQQILSIPLSTPTWEDLAKSGLSWNDLRTRGERGKE